MDLSASLSDLLCDATVEVLDISFNASRFSAGQVELEQHKMCKCNCCVGKWPFGCGDGKLDFHLCETFFCFRTHVTPNVKDSKQQFKNTGTVSLKIGPFQNLDVVADEASDFFFF